MVTRTADYCVAVVAAPGDFADLLHLHVENDLGVPALLCAYEELDPYLSRETDGLLLTTVTSAHEQQQLVQLLQDISLQQFQPAVVIVQKDRCRDLPRWAWFPEWAAHVYWPSELEKLDELIRDADECAVPFFDKKDLPLAELLYREFQHLTPSLEPLIDRIVLAAGHDVTVLLTGETGSGKTYCARLIHQYSARKNERFLPVSCGALAADLVESEFFGHVRGAFTGADQDKIGKFEAAGAGTLLLDEIDTLSLKHQAALLRVIETGEFEAIGSHETKKTRARILVASNIPLEQAVDDGDFRADLYYRLNVMSFHFPPLCERIADIEPLARSMAARYNRKFSRNLFDISPQALAALESYPWPGNIRQLENAIQHAVLLSTGPEVQLQHLPETIQEPVLHDYPKPAHSDQTLHHQRDLSERNAIQKALVTHGYNRSRAAEALGISRVTLYKKMEKYGLTNIPIQPARKFM